MDEIIITPNSTFDEFQRSISLPFKKTVAQHALRIVSALLGATMILTILETWGSPAVDPAILAGICLVIILILSNITASSRLRACYLAGSDDPATYTFSESGVTGACGCTKTTFLWAAFDRALDAGTMYVLFTKSLACVRIPKRNIPAASLDAFPALLREKLGRLH